MKTKQLLLLALLLAFALLSTTCSKKEQNEANSPNDIGTIVSVFELKYGAVKEISDKEDKITFSLKEIKDNVDIDCSLVDFTNNEEAPLNIRIYSYLKVNNQDTYIEVKSKPCGALQYNDNTDDIQEILDRINDLKSAPANVNNQSYYPNEFINLFGEGSTIKDTAFRIFIAKAFPVNYKQPNTDIHDYKFIFIITRKN